MPSGNSKSSKPKPSEVAAETKKYYIPTIRKNYAARWNTCSLLYPMPLAYALLPRPEPPDLSPPVFSVHKADPVDFALNWAASGGQSIPLICPANDKRPGGDWDTGVVGYEERLCRRSTLAAAMATPAANCQYPEHYPIPITGGIFSHQVVVFRGPHDRYEKWAPEQWQDLPVCSIPPTRWPKLTQNGTKYSFEDERQVIKDKLRGAVRICAYNNYESVVVVGDFGLGNSYRNPPLELAEMWREVFLFDPDLRGRIRYVAFVFEDGSQSTTQLIIDDIAKKAKGGKGKSHSSGGSSSSSSSSGGMYLSDHDIFSRVFDNIEVQRVLTQPDSRYELNNLLM